MSDVTVQPIPPPEAGDGALVEEAPRPAPPAPGGPRRSVRRRMALVAGLVALALAGAAAVYFLALRHDQVRVPGVVGRDQATAARLTAGAGLRVRIERVRSERPSGLVVSQSPAPRAQADKHSTVVLRLSAGPGLVAVPDLRGQAPASAEQALRDAGLTFALTRQPSTAVPAGQVASSSPAPGSQAGRGSPVTLAISTGPASVRTPNVVGQREAAAQARVARAGFQVVIVRQESSQPAGQVIAQRPLAGQRRKKGTAVQVVVAAAPPQVSVADVTGLDLESAVTTLSGMGLRIEFRDRRAGRGERTDTVATQDPPAHSSIAKGATVTLTVTKR
jgi:eukaryotic-like serine/threonine-protein kinase